MRRSCKACIHWQPPAARQRGVEFEPTVIGQCRRNPPRADGIDPDAQARFPRIQANAWCGDWAPFVLIEDLEGDPFNPFVEPIAVPPPEPRVEPAPLTPKPRRFNPPRRVPPPVARELAPDQVCDLDDDDPFRSELELPCIAIMRDDHGWLTVRQIGVGQNDVITRVKPGADAGAHKVAKCRAIDRDMMLLAGIHSKAFIDALAAGAAAAGRAVR